MLGGEEHLWVIPFGTEKPAWSTSTDQQLEHIWELDEYLCRFDKLQLNLHVLEAQ